MAAISGSKACPAEMRSGGWLASIPSPTVAVEISVNTEHRQIAASSYSLVIPPIRKIGHHQQLSLEENHGTCSVVNAEKSQPPSCQRQ